jgi:hypothetical protein
MRILGKCLALFLTIMVVTSSMALLIAKPVAAQTVPTPSVPEFSIRLVNGPYLVTSTDSYYMQLVTRPVSNRSIEIIIKNQPFNYANSSYSMYYNVRFKPHFQQDGWWMEVGSVKQSSGEQTTVTFALAKFGDSYDLGYYNKGVATNDLSFPLDGQIDFQVQAQVGHDSQLWTHFIGSYDFPYNGDGFIYAVDYDSSSNWSDTQTVNLPDFPVPDVSSNALAFPDWSWIVIIAVLAAMLLIALAVRHRKKP